MYGGTNPSKRDHNQLSPEEIHTQSKKLAMSNRAGNQSGLSELLVEMRLMNKNFSALSDRIDGFVSKWETEKAAIEERQSALESRLDRLERQEKRNSVTIVGLNEVENVKSAVGDLFTNTLGVAVKVNEAFAIKQRSGEVRVIAKLNSWDDKLSVMKAKGKLPDKVFINDDLIPKDRILRSKAVQYAKTLPKDGRRVQIRNDRVIVDGEPHVWNPTSESFVLQKNM